MVTSDLEVVVQGIEPHRDIYKICTIIPKISFFSVISFVGSFLFLLFLVCVFLCCCCLMVYYLLLFSWFGGHIQ